MKLFNLRTKLFFKDKTIFLRGRKLFFLINIEEEEEEKEREAVIDSYEVNVLNESINHLSSDGQIDRTDIWFMF